jgi:tRNA-uridine 2-sulfurtransferase
MRVLVAMSGGVDSALCAALLRDEGHEVVGATLKLWGGPSDSGCCSLADVTDARRVADHLGIEHHVFNMTEAFETHVVGPYVDAHAAARTPNPCVECNRHIKFAALLDKAERLGFEALATGHHARIGRDANGTAELERGVDPAKDQSYVLSVLGAAELARVLLPIGHYDKATVRALARDRGIRVADKAESQDVCFIARRGEGSGRAAFLGERIALHPGVVRDQTSGAVVGSVDAIELLTIGQRKGLDLALGEPRYVVDIDAGRREVTIGEREALLTDEVRLAERTWTGASVPTSGAVLVQMSAHGTPVPAMLTESGVRLLAPTRRVAPGQVVALYREGVVLGSGIAA